MDGMVQVFIEAGEFLMGSIDNEAIQRIEGGRAYPEIPQHVNTTGEYWIDMYEVSNAQYALCVTAGVCTAPYLPKSETRESYFGNPEFDNYPVIWVSWYMATDYCEWAGRRLPTEAEWEKAARGTEGLKYPWGNELGDNPPANFCDTNCGRTIANHKYDDGYPDTAPVDSFPDGVSPYGVFNMSGNVWEWTSSIIEPYPYDPDDGREDPDVWKERVWRGGPWTNGYWWLRSSVRYRSIATYWYVNLGFRCAETGGIGE
jgi:serine/threonine-protein kinase